MRTIHENIDNPIVDLPTLRRDLYFLMSLLLADKKVTKIQNVTARTKVFHENEVRRLILWVALAVRGLLDLDLPENGKMKEISEQICGEYWVNFPGGEKRPLQFRRACNSAVHAKEILLYRVPEQEDLDWLYQKKKSMTSPRKVPEVDHYIDRFTIRGIHRNKTTRAQIDIIQFVQIGSGLINSFEEN